MSTRFSAFAFSQVALASRVFASSGRMSYLSKSKYTACRASTAATSFGDGRAAAVGEAAVAGAAGTALGARAAVAGAGSGDAARDAGAGAAVAAVVAGRFAQPLMIRPTSSSDITVTCAPRITMTPPYDFGLEDRSGPNRITAGVATMRDLWPRSCLA